jgi:hypothetical protein
LNHFAASLRRSRRGIDPKGFWSEDLEERSPEELTLRLGKSAISRMKKIRG